MTTRIAYGSGFPYTPETSVYVSSTKTYIWNLGNPDAAYLPAYKRVDFRVSKNFEIFGCSSSAFLDISNIFNFNNVQAYQYTFTNNGQPEVDEIKLWPILPTLGISVSF